MLNASSLAIISHINPDGDTLGSSLALYNALKNLNKNVQVFCDSNIKNDFADMAGGLAIVSSKHFCWASS